MRKWTKKSCRLFVMVILMLTFTGNTIAFADSGINEITPVNTNQEMEIAIPIYASPEEAQQAYEAKQADANQARSGAIVVDFYFSRQSPTSTTVHPYIVWSGKDPINGFRWKSLTISNPSAFDKTVYAKFLPNAGQIYRTWSVNTSASGRATLVKLLDVPTDVDLLKVSVSDLQVYVSSEGWESCSSPFGNWEID